MPETRACDVCGAMITAAYCPRCGAADSEAKEDPGYDTRVAPSGGQGESTTLFQPSLLGENDETDVDPSPELGYLSTDGSSPEEIPLFGEKTTFGRKGAQVNLPDPAMSSPHFELTRAAGAYFLRDLDSASGTFLNDRRIKSCELAVGDIIRAGTTRLTFSQSAADD